MKKSTTILMAALFGLVGFSASAQSQDNRQCQAGCHAQKAGDMNKMRQPREFTEFAFEGILLDINQQTRIDSLNAAVKANAPQAPQCQEGKEGKCGKCGPECAGSDNCKNKDNCKKADCPKDKKQCAKDNKECAKDGKCAKCGDTKCKKGESKCDGPKHGMRERPGLPYGPEYIAKVKEILTPEQYTIFLENVVEYQNNRPDGMMGHGPKANGQKPDCKNMPKSPNACCKHDKK